MEHYKVKVPPTWEQGNTEFTCSTSYLETRSAAALWVYNSMRAHDGQAPLTKMPKGTEYTRLYKFSDIHIGESFLWGSIDPHYKKTGPNSAERLSDKGIVKKSYSFADGVMVARKGTHS